MKQLVDRVILRVISTINCCLSSCFLVLVMHLNLSSVSTFQERKCFVSAGSDGVDRVGVSILFRSCYVRSSSSVSSCFLRWRLGLRLSFGNGCVLETDLEKVSS